jgi:vitamin B12 transporter
MLFANQVPQAPWVRLAVASAVFSCASLLSLASHAAEASLEAVVVTASRSPQNLRDVLADVTVISREDIERQAYGDLPSLLSRFAGIEIARSGGVGAPVSVFTRGADVRFTTVLIDGVRVETQTTQGGAPWANLPLNNIERIEIVRGAGSAAYGSSAVAGVVQIFTRKGTGVVPLVNVGVSLGGKGLRKGDVSLSGVQGNVDYAFSIANETSNGTSAITRTDGGFNDFNPDADGYDQQYSSGRLGWQVAAGHHLTLSAADNKIRSEFDDQPIASPFSKSSLRTLQLQWTAQWSTNLQGTYQVGEAVDTLNSFGEYPVSNRTRVETLLVQHDWTTGPHAIQAILERKEDQLSYADSIGGNKQRALNGLALSYTLQGKAQSVQVRVRHDEDSEFGKQTTGSLAWGHELSQDWRLRASVANAFRVPTLFERYYQYGGNSKLNMETSRSVDIGVSWASGPANFSATLYRNDISDLINYVGAGYTNVGEALLQGLSLSWSYPVSGVRVYGSLDVQDPKNKATGKLLVRRAKEHGVIGLEADWMDWSVGAELHASSYRMDGSKRLPGYGVVDVFAQRQLSKQVQLQFKVENVADKYYETAYGYGQAGVTGSASLRFTTGQ